MAEEGIAAEAEVTGVVNSGSKFAPESAFGSPDPSLELLLTLLKIKCGVLRRLPTG
jgi:hypothetical protein